VYQLGLAIYNLYFHPLAKYPGPFLNRASPLPFGVRHARGTAAFACQRWHEQYGPVLRVGPNHLSFTDVRAWKDIYGHRVGVAADRAEFPKTDVFSNTIDAIPPSIVGETRTRHAAQRRALSHGFSDSSMRAQEPTIRRFVDLLLQRLHERCGGGTVPLNAEAWYNYTTFDVVGTLVFGEAFGCLDSSEYHPWVAFIIKAVVMGSITVSLAYVGLRWLVQVLWKLGGAAAITRAQKLSRSLVDKRLGTQKGREGDLFEGLASRKEELVSGTLLTL